MQQCTGCQYKTNVPANMQKHKRNSGHDRTAARKKEFRGHLASQKKKRK